MAVINKLNQDDPNDPSATQQGPSAIPTVGGQQNASIPSTGQGSAPVAGAAPVGSGRFTNLQNYITANKGSGEKIAGKIGENVQKAADDTQKAVAATGTVQSQLDAEKNRLAQASGFAQQIGTNAVGLAADQNNVDAIAKLRSGETAATDINNVAQNKLNSANSALQNLQQNAQNTATETGRFQLLQQALGRPSYNQGQQRLDQLLVQNGGGNVLNNLQKTAQNTAANANKTLATTASNLNNGIADVKSQAGAAQKAIMDSIGSLDNAATEADDRSGALGSLQSELQKRQQEFIAQNQAAYDKLQAAKGGTSFDADTAALLGIKDGQQLFDVDIANMIQPQWASGTVSEQSVANADELARYQALAKLAGVDPAYLTQSQVGTAKGVSVDPTALQQSLAARQAQYDALTATDLYKNIGTTLKDYLNTNVANGSLLSGSSELYNSPALMAAIQGGTYNADTALATINAIKANPYLNRALAGAIETQGNPDPNATNLYGQAARDQRMRLWNLYQFATQYQPFNSNNRASVYSEPQTGAVNDNTFGVK